MHNIPYQRHYHWLIELVKRSFSISISIDTQLMFKILDQLIFTSGMIIRLMHTQREPVLCSQTTTRADTY